MSEHQFNSKRFPSFSFIGRNFIISSFLDLLLSQTQGEQCDYNNFVCDIFKLFFKCFITNNYVSPKQLETQVLN